MKVDQLNHLNAMVLPVIRSTNPTRGVVLGGAGWMSIWWLRGWWGHMLNVTYNNDPNLLLELHDYSPTNLSTPASQKQPMASIAWGTAEDAHAHTNRPPLLPLTQPKPNPNRMWPLCMTILRSSRSTARPTRISASY